MRSNSCPKCASSMVQGYVLDHDTSSGHRNAIWVEGAPQKGWFGVKTGKRAKFDIQTWRCGRCGFLESYARG